MDFCHIEGLSWKRADGSIIHNADRPAPKIFRMSVRIDRSTKFNAL